IFVVVITIILVIVTLVFMVYCSRNFGEGLLNNKKENEVRVPFSIDGDDETGPEQKNLPQQQQDELNSSRATNQLQNHHDQRNFASHQQNPNQYYNNQFGGGQKMEIE